MTEEKKAALKKAAAKKTKSEDKKVTVNEIIEAIKGLSVLELSEMVKELEMKGKMSESDGKQFLKELRKKYDDAQKKMGDKVEKTGKEFFKKVNVVTSDELNGLIKEIRELKKANITTAE